MSEESIIPKHWQIKNLGEVAKIRGGKRLPKGDSYSMESTDYPYLRVTDFESQTIQIDKLKYLKKSTQEAIKNYTISKDDVYISIAGTIGLTGTIPDFLDGSNLTENAAKITELTDCFNKYISLYLSSILGQSQIKEFTKTTTQPKLSLYRIEQLEIPFPTLTEQQAIVFKIEELLSDLENGKQQLQIAQQQLKIYRQSLLKWAFEGKLSLNYDSSEKSLNHDSCDLLDEQDLKNKSKINLGNHINLQNHSSDNLPKGWKMISLGDVIDKPQYGTSKKCDYGIDGKGVLRIPNITSGYINSSDLKYAIFDSSEIENYKLKEGDILTIRSNGSVDLVGKSALIKKKEEKYLFAGYLIKLRPKQNFILPKFLLNVLSSSSLRVQIEGKAKSTSGVNNINSEELKSLLVPICSLEEQQLIVDELESKLTVCDKIEETIKEALLKSESLRQSILKKAFSGKLVNNHVNP